MRNLFTLVASCSLVVTGCSNPVSNLIVSLQDSIKYHIELAKHSKDGYSTLKLKSITKFDWDKLYVFDEYITSKQVNSITALNWSGPDVPSGERRLFFISKNKQVHYIDYASINFPLYMHTCEKKEQFEFDSKDDELFAVFQACVNNKCSFFMTPARCVDDFKRFYRKD